MEVPSFVPLDTAFSFLFLQPSSMTLTWPYQGFAFLVQFNSAKHMGHGLGGWRLVPGLPKQWSASESAVQHKGVEEGQVKGWLYTAGYSLAGESTGILRRTTRPSWGRGRGPKEQHELIRQMLVHSRHRVKHQQRIRHSLVHSEYAGPSRRLRERRTEQSLGS